MRLGGEGAIMRLWRHKGKYFLYLHYPFGFGDLYVRHMLVEIARICQPSAIAHEQKHFH